MDEEIKTELDDLLTLGQVSRDDYERRLDALRRADELLSAAEDPRNLSEEGRAGGLVRGVLEPLRLPDTAGKAQTLEKQGRAGLWARLRDTWDDLPFRKTRQLLLIIYILMWIYQIPPSVIAFVGPGYVFGAFFGLIPLVIGLFRKSDLTGKSVWSCIISGSLSVGVLALPVAIACAVKMFRQNDKHLPVTSM